MKPIDFVYRFNPAEPQTRTLPKDALEARLALEEGNRLFSRWIDTCMDGHNVTESQQFVLSYDAQDLGLPGPAGQPGKQSPFAVLVGCSDARVPAEIIFGQARNNLFVVRLAGNVLSDECLGSVDFAVNHLSHSIRIIVVLGHTQCGAVAAAVDTYLHPWSYLEKANTNGLRSIVDRLFNPVRKAAGALKQMGITGDADPDSYRAALIETAVFVNAAQTAHDLHHALESIGRQDLQVVYGVYDLVAHRVRTIPEHLPEAASTEFRLASAPASLEELKALTLLMAHHSLPAGRRS